MSDAEAVGDQFTGPMSKIAAAAQPVRIVTIDAEGPLPELMADDRYETAWVEARVHGIPRCMVTVDLSSHPSVIQHRLREIVAKARDTSVEPARQLSDDELPSISVVVPTIVMRTEDLKRCLDSIAQLDYPKFDLVVVDNRRELPDVDPLSELVADRPRTRVVRETRPGVSAARNAGVRNAVGDVVAFTDDDVQVSSGWLRAIGTRFAENPDIDIVTGLIMPSELETPAQIWFERYYGGFSGQRSFDPVTVEVAGGNRYSPTGSHLSVRDGSGHELRTVSILAVGGFGAGANMAIRRSAIEEIGGFDGALGTGTRARGGEDLVVMMKTLWNGGKLGYEPAAFVHHRHRRKYSDLLVQMDGYGLGFTAALTAVVRHDPRRSLRVLSQLHVVAIWKSAQALGHVRRELTERRARTSTPSYPLALYFRELRAFFAGPFEYLRSERLTKQ